MSSETTFEVEHSGDHSDRTLGNSEWLTVQEVVAELKVSRDTVERWIHSGQLRAANVGAVPHHGVGRASWRVSAKALDEFLAARASQAPLPASPKLHRRKTDVIEFVR